MQIELPNKQLIKHIEILRIEREREYENDSKQLLHQFHKDLANEINQSQTDDKQFDIETYICNGFPWNSKVMIKPYLKSWINQKSSERKIEFSESNMYNDFINQEFNWLIAEAIFGSYWSIIEGIKNEGDINTTLINKVDLRRKSILSIINAQSFNKKQYSKYCNLIISQIWEEMRMASINHLNERVIGWQKEWICDENTIVESPFETIKKLSSTRGRLILIQNWDKLIRHPNFLNQMILKDSYGVSISKNKSDLSKLC